MLAELIQKAGLSGWMADAARMFVILLLTLLATYAARLLVLLEKCQKEMYVKRERSTDYIRFLWMSGAHELLLKPSRQASLNFRSDNFRVRNLRLKEDCNRHSCQHAEPLF